jgi:hypothetical protein
MPLLNYTTEVPALRSASQIQETLAKAGARQVMMNYDADGRPSGVAFGMETAFGARQFVLPVNPLRVLAVMKKDRVQPRFQSYEQAERVAWRILKDWIEAQLALISTEMVSLDQVMLPYMAGDNGRTVYELYVEREQQALPAADVEEVA